MSVGLFVAGGGKDAGKTTLCLGLVSYFKDNLPNGAAFIKPIGQKAVISDGAAVGQDSYFLDHALRLGLSLDKTAPFSAASGAAEKYIATGEPRDIAQRIKSSYDELASKHDMVIIEGTGHPGVGSVFDMSNGAVASLLGVPVILILDGGVGSTIDRFTLCEALFKLEKVRIMGVIINRIMPDKMEKVKEHLTPWFERRGIPIFGFIPYDNIISIPSIENIGKELAAEGISMNGIDPDHPISGVLTSFGSSEEVLKKVEENPFCALVLSSGRLTVLQALLARKFAGQFPNQPGALVLCGETPVEPWIEEACRKLSLPLFYSKNSADDAVQKIAKKVFKVEPDEAVKIEEMVRLVHEYVDIEAIYRELTNLPEIAEKRKNGLVKGLLNVSGRFLKTLFGKK